MADPSLAPPAGGPASVRRRWLGPLLVVFLAASIVLSVAAGSPDPLPGAALGSTAMLFAERAVAIFVALFLGLLVIYRGFLGELPDERSGRGVKYAERDAVDQLRSELSDAIEQLRENQETLRDAVEEILVDTGDDPQGTG